jgi:hypothetical protein
MLGTFSNHHAALLSQKCGQCGDFHPKSRQIPSYSSTDSSNSDGSPGCSLNGTGGLFPIFPRNDRGRLFFTASAPRIAAATVLLSSNISCSVGSTVDVSFSCSPESPRTGAVGKQVKISEGVGSLGGMMTSGAGSCSVRYGFWT